MSAREKRPHLRCSNGQAGTNVCTMALTIDIHHYNHITKVMNLLMTIAREAQARLVLNTMAACVDRGATMLGMPC